MLKMVIVSHLGELTQDTRIVGDTIRFRIYYDTAAHFGPELTIIDPLEEGLSEVNVFNGGQYNPATRTITWTVKVPIIKRKTFVEFEAVIGPSKQICNQAFLKGLGSFQQKSNSVEINVGESPTLGWIPFVEDASPGEPPRVYMKDETTMGTTVRFDIPGVYVYEERVDGVAYQRLSIAGRATLTEVGKPELPIAGEILEVPFDVNFAPEIIEATTTVLKGYNLYPAQPPRSETSVAQPPRSKATLRVQPFILDKTTYLTNADYPPIVAVAADEDIAVIRGHRVMFLKINPIQYNPVTRSVTVYSSIEVRLHYNHPAQLKGIDRRIASPAFEELLKATVLNYKDPRRFYRPKAEESEEKTGGCDYLIITEDAFYNENDASNPIVRLRNWKRRKGYRATVVKVSSIPGGNTPNAIKNYIQGAYDQWNPAPSYILLVGDADLVGAVPGLHHPMENDLYTPQPQIETDLYYTTVDGPSTDYFPDIYIGRLSANNLQQVTDIVDKILAYEQTPPVTPAHAAFYTDVSLVGLFTDYDQGLSVIDGRESRPWISNLETIRQYLLNQNYNVERIYVTDSGFPANPNASAPVKFQDGTALPNDLKSPNYAWNGGTGNIRTAINNGRFLVTYRAHGNPDSWDTPAFSNADIGNLNQNGLTPVVFSITCQTGWFDNETDDDTKGGRPANANSFTEVFLQQQNSGAVAVLGMTRVSYTGWNDFIVFGLYKAIWPNFAPNPPWSNHPNVPNVTPVPLLRMGQILNFGRMFMARTYNPGDTRKLEFEMEHLFGDPEMPIWTEAPGNIRVAHPLGIGATGVQEFVIQVMSAANGQPVEGAAVVLTRGDEIVQMEQTHSDGLAHFKLASIGVGDLDVTVTALTYRPYMGVIMVHRGEAVLNRLEPLDGPEGQTIHVGGQGFQGSESVDLYFDQLGPFTVATDANGEFGQGSPTVDITVPVGYAHGLVNVLAHGQESDLYAVRVFQVRDKNPVDLWTYDQWDSSTWTVHPGDNPTWNSPDIQLYDRAGHAVDSNNLTLMEPYTVKVNVRNKSAFIAQQARVVFQWRNFGAGGPWQDFATEHTTPPDVPVNPGTATAQTTFSPQATGHLCLKIRIEHMEDINSGNNEGQENLHVGYSNSPAEVCFLIWNPTEDPTPVHLEVRQLIPPGQERNERLWATWVKHPDPQVLLPGERAEACVVVNPDVADVIEGTQAEFTVTAFIGSQTIGGVNLIMIKS